MITVLPATVVLLTLAGTAAAQTLPAAGAQTASTSPIGSLVSAGDQVSITTADGVIHQGRVLSLTKATIELQLAESKQTTTLPFDRMRRVDVRFHDGLADGFKWGLVAGVVGGAVIGTVSVAADCHKRSADESCTAADAWGALAIATGASAAAGAMLGTVADALHLSEREVWRAPRPLALTWIPIAAPRRAGLRFTMRW